MCRLILICSLIAFSINAGSEIQKVEQKIGVIDLEETLNRVADGQAAKSKLQDEFKKKQDILDRKQNELKKLQDTLQNKSSILSEDAKQKKAMEFQEKYAEAQQLYNTTQQEFMKSQQEAMSSMVKKANPIIEDIAKKNGYSIILNKTEATVLYADPSVNMTEEIIKRYNSSYPVKALPASKSKKK